MANVMNKLKYLTASSVVTLGLVFGTVANSNAQDVNNKPQTGVTVNNSVDKIAEKVASHVRQKLPKGDVEFDTQKFSINEIVSAANGFKPGDFDQIVNNSTAFFTKLESELSDYQVKGFLDAAQKDINATRTMASFLRDLKDPSKALGDVQVNPYGTRNGVGPLAGLVWALKNPDDNITGGLTPREIYAKLAKDAGLLNTNIDDALSERAKQRKELNASYCTEVEYARIMNLLGQYISDFTSPKVQSIEINGKTYSLDDAGKKALAQDVLKTVYDAHLALMKNKLTLNNLVMGVQEGGALSTVLGLNASGVTVDKQTAAEYAALIGYTVGDDVAFKLLQYANNAEKLNAPLRDVLPAKDCRNAELFIKRVLGKDVGTLGDVFKALLTEQNKTPMLRSGAPGSDTPSVYFEVSYKARELANKLAGFVVMTNEKVIIKTDGGMRDGKVSAVVTNGDYTISQFGFGGMLIDGRVIAPNGSFEMPELRVNKLAEADIRFDMPFGDDRSIARGKGQSGLSIHGGIGISANKVTLSGLPEIRVTQNNCPPGLPPGACDQAGQALNPLSVIGFKDGSFNTFGVDLNGGVTWKPVTVGFQFDYHFLSRDNKDPAANNIWGTGSNRFVLGSELNLVKYEDKKNFFSVVLSAGGKYIFVNPHSDMNRKPDFTDLLESAFTNPVPDQATLDNVKVAVDSRGVPVEYRNLLEGYTKITGTYKDFSLSFGINAVKQMAADWDIRNTMGANNDLNNLKIESADIKFYPSATLTWTFKGNNKSERGYKRETTGYSTYSSPGVNTYNNSKTDIEKTRTTKRNDWKTWALFDISRWFGRGKSEDTKRWEKPQDAEVTSFTEEKHSKPVNIGNGEKLYYKSTETIKSESGEKNDKKVVEQTQNLLKEFDKTGLPKEATATQHQRYVSDSVKTAVTQKYDLGYVTTPVNEKTVYVQPVIIKQSSDNAFDALKNEFGSAPQEEKKVVVKQPANTNVVETKKQDVKPLTDLAKKYQKVSSFEQPTNVVPVDTLKQKFMVPADTIQKKFIVPADTAKQYKAPVLKKNMTSKYQNRQP